MIHIGYHNCHATQAVRKIMRDGNKNMRVFFALWPDDAGRRALTDWQSPLVKLCGGKAMRPETMHNTLVFLGNVAVDRLEALVLVAQETAGTAFNLRFDEARYWRHNHIVYAVPGEVPVQLTQLVQSLQQHLRRHRFSFDQREYKPHVTLLRHANCNGAPLSEMPAFAWPVHDFVLVQSLSDENGARYQVLARFPLHKS